MLTGCKNFNGRYGCQKCEVRGKYHNKFHTMSFGNLSAARRTDASYRSREQPDHHLMYSIIEELEIDMIESFSIADTLHLLELGDYN